jgi:hypothetical protein
MVDEGIATGDISATSAPAPAVETSTPSTAPSQTSGVKTLHQDQIDSIVRDAHHRGYTKREREIANSQQQQTQQQAQPQTQSQSPAGFSQDEMRKMASEEAMRAVQQAQMQHSADMVYNQFNTKMQAAAAKYPDFAQKINQLDLSRMVDIVQLSSQLENTGDVMYDLAANPYKIANLQLLAQSQPVLAQQELQKLSASIKANQAPAAPSANAPLNQVSSSPLGVSTDGVPDWGFFDKKYRG